jgi:hypothetical protein
MKLMMSEITEGERELRRKIRSNEKLLIEENLRNKESRRKEGGHKKRI